MDLKQLEYIVMIAEENSITKAAERLFITQSGLNQQLLKLEAELGIQLFHRSKMISVSRKPARYTSPTRKKFFS